MHAYNPESYQPKKLSEWIAIAERQAPKDRILIPRIARLLGDGPVLELGSGTGHIALLLQSLGHQVVASDYAPFFVEHERSKGLEAHRIDATDIAQSGIEKFPNIFCQSITPFITDDMTVVDKAYRSVFDALLPGGRLVLIHAMAPRARLKETIDAHRASCTRASFQDVTIRRDQLLPTPTYKLPLAGVVDALFAPLLGSRFILSATKMPGIR